MFVSGRSSGKPLRLAAFSGGQQVELRDDLKKIQHSSPVCQRGDDNDDVEESNTAHWMMFSST